MSSAIITVENLGKRYSLHHQRDQRYTALRDVIMEKATSLFKRSNSTRGNSNGASADFSVSESQRLSLSPPPPAREDFWALRHVSFEVQQGEVVGIIGRNGAGKSTLLKILSRITDPSEGRVRIRGRVASLLEVGTGFHPELTGRENIFLNGAILGMGRAEIKAKFDEIVSFAEVEKFLDTPVKHYSSGMYVRLAFAVAAHLEPEILIVDEVLAVGDAQFQKKCIGKMQQIAKGEGRTVLFVSHNIPVVLRLCDNGFLLSGGRLTAAANIRAVVDKYITSGEIGNDRIDLVVLPRSTSVGGDAKLVAAEPSRQHGLQPWQFEYGQSVSFQIHFCVTRPLFNFLFGVALFDRSGYEIASSLSAHRLGMFDVQPGSYKLDISYPKLGLLPGVYRLGLSIKSDSGFADYLDQGLAFEVVATELAARHRIETFNGVLVPEVDYSLSNM
jgi:lipopolysaccharide transport system ATP-binding protein